VGRRFKSDARLHFKTPQVIGLRGFYLRGLRVKNQAERRSVVADAAVGQAALEAAPELERFDLGADLT
jgi:hypothetical protein